jgi:outer membrane protein TolC
VRINNQQLIASRETKVIEAERKLEQAAIKLSLFLRTPDGEPLVPDESRLPATFPLRESPDRTQLQADVATAIAASPELLALGLLDEQVRVELAHAENTILPKLDALILASKDVGFPTSSLRNKMPFELEAGLVGELPYQRRQARGKILAAQGKLAQIQAKRQFTINKITAGVQDAFSALEAAAERIDRAQTNLRLARETLDLGRLQFDEGDIDLIALNILENSVTDAQLLLISAQADFLTSLADYRAVLSLDPIAIE